MFVVGKTGSGKTSLMADVLLKKWLKQFLYKDAFGRARYNIFILCPTYTNQVLLGPSRPYYKLWNYVDPQNVFQHASPQSLKAILDKTAACTKAGERCLIWLDDITGTGLLYRRASSVSPLSQFLTTMSHMNVSVVIMWHVLSAASRIIRESAGHVVLFQPTSTTEADNMAKEFSGPVKKVDFVKALIENTREKGGFLHVNLTAGEFFVKNAKNKTLFR
jgi:hypothetical protein